MHKPQQQVLEFHQAFGVAAPHSLDPAAFPGELRIALVDEEAREFAAAVRSGDPVAIVHELVDLLYVTYGAAVALGVDVEGAFDLVHAANLGKLGGERRADGKVLKPAGWQPADITGWLVAHPATPAQRSV